MHRSDKSKFLLYIEPKKEYRTKVPLLDELTAVASIALLHAKKGGANYSKIGEEMTFQSSELGGWRGHHTTDCGQNSTNYDYLLENGMVTNSLAPFYLAYYRDQIPQTEIDKASELLMFYRFRS